MSERETDFVEVLVALREVCLKAVDAINAYMATQAPPAVRADELREKIPPELRDFLEFDMKGDICVIRPRQYLGAENFAKVAAIIRQSEGYYISDGKNSRFEVPLAKA